MSLKTIAATLLVIIIWGSNFSVIKGAVSEIPPLVFLAMRFTVAALCFLPFVEWKTFWPNLKNFFIIGLFLGILHQGTLFAGLSMTEAGLMSILLQSQVIMSTLIGWFFFKEIIKWRTWTGIALGFVGIAVLILPNLNGSSAVLSYVLGLASALSIALAYLRMKSLSKVHPVNFIVGINITVLPIVWLMAFTMESNEWMSSINSLQWNIILPALAFQVIALSFSHMMWQRLLSNNPISQIVPWCLLIPVVGVACGTLFLGETITTGILVGGGLTIFGVGIITFRSIKKKSI